jgi:hypothetical protein
MTSGSLPIVTTVLLLGGACGGLAESDSTNGDPCANMACRPTTTVDWTASFGDWPLDLLVVVDDRVPSSAAGTAFADSMRALAANMQAQMDDPFLGTDIHIAMVPSSLTVETAIPRLWPSSNDCQQPAGDYLHAGVLCDSPGNFSAPLADALACAGTHMPASGQPSRPLDVVRTLLSPGGLAETTGFRRPQAPLFLAIITAEDDPAVATASERTSYYDSLIQLLHGSDYLEVAVVAPADAQGLIEFAKLFDWIGTADDIAADSWRGLSSLGSPWEAYLRNLCIHRYDVPDGFQETGQQPDCRVVEQDVSSDGSTTELSIPACPLDGLPSGPCWRAVVDTLRCPSDGVRIEIAPTLTCRPSYRIRYQATCAQTYLPAVSNQRKEEGP